MLIGISLMFAGKIYMATGTETFVFKDTQLYKDIEYYNDNFQATNFLVLITAEDVLDPVTLEAMDLIEQRVKNNPKIGNVTGLNTFVRQAAYAEYGYEMIPRNRIEVERLMSNSSGERAMFVMPNRHHAVMTIELRGNIEEKDEGPILEEVKSVIKWVPMTPGSSALVTGKTAMMLEVQKEMMHNMMIMLATATGLMIIALWFTFSHSKWRLLPLPIVLVGVIYTGGIMGFTGVPLTMVSMAVFPILIGLGVEYSIQFQNRAMEELASGKLPGDAIVSTIRNIGPPVFYSVMTTCLGFSAILSSPVPMVHDFGLMCLIGVIACFLTALFVLVSILYVLSSTRKGSVTTYNQGTPTAGRIEKAITSISDRTVKYPIVVVIALAAMAVGYWLDPTIGIEIDSSTFSPQDLPSVVLFRTFNNIIGYKTDDMVVQVKSNDVTSPETIKWIKDFSDYEKSHNHDVLSVSSIATAMAAYNNGQVPLTRPEITKTLDRVPHEVKKQYVDQYGTTGIVRMKIQDQPTEKKMSMLRMVERDLTFYRPPPGVNASLSGDQQVTLITLSYLTSDRLTMTIIGALSVFTGLMIVYRGDWVKAIAPVVAVVVVTGLSCLVMIILKMKYTPLSVTLGALTIGIGIDFSILHMERYFEERSKGHEPTEAMRIATGKIGNAIFSSATTVIAGFGALVMSNFSILSNFGIITIIDFILALMSAFMIMPPLLVTLDRWRIGRAARSGRSVRT